VPLSCFTCVLSSLRLSFRSRAVIDPRAVLLVALVGFFSFPRGRRIVTHILATITSPTTCHQQHTAHRDQARKVLDMAADGAGGAFGSLFPAVIKRLSPSIRASHPPPCFHPHLNSHPRTPTFAYTQEPLTTTTSIRCPLRWLCKCKSEAVDLRRGTKTTTTKHAASQGSGGNTRDHHPQPIVIAYCGCPAFSLCS